MQKETIQTILQESEKVRLTDECFNIITFIRKSLTEKNSKIEDESEKYQISDRRWKKIVNLMRVSAYCNNRNETDIMDATLIADCIWSTENQEKEVKEIVKNAIALFGVKCHINISDIKKRKKEIEEKIKEAFYEETYSYKPKMIERKGEDYYAFKLNEKNDNYYYIKQNLYERFKNGEISSVLINAGHDLYYGSRIYGHVLPSGDITVGSDTYVLQKVKNEKAGLQKKQITQTAYNYIKKGIMQEVETLTNEIDVILANNDNISDSESQFKSNLFADYELYYDVIFKEKIDVKTKLTSFKNEINKSCNEI